MMEVHLMFPDRDFDLEGALPANASDLIQDLELETLFRAMAGEDAFLLRVARQAVLASLTDLDLIRYRQEILWDCLNHPDVVKQLYQVPMEFLERKRSQWLWISTRHANPSSILSSALHMLEASLDLLGTLKQIADRHAGSFESSGFKRLFRMFQNELDDVYLSHVARHLKQLRFTDGALVRAQLGKGNEGTGYVLCKPNAMGSSWLKRVFTKKSPVYSFALHPRDEHGAQALAELRDRGIVQVAGAVARAADRIEGFFNVLRLELAFYLGCLNLRDALTRLGEPVTIPRPTPVHERTFTCKELYDVTLALTLKRRVVSNDIAAPGKDLVIITGPNQGGKTTFLRSVGQAQLMAQCGMFVPASFFSSNLFTGLFTHFKREEDKTMKSGKFSEELRRMSAIVDLMVPHALILFNESFAATNEREGSEVAKQIVSALIDKRIKVFFVTHFYEFAQDFYNKGRENVLFLRAERLQDQRRTFKMKEGRPLETSFGVDLYKKIFTEKNRDGVR